MKTKHISEAGLEQLMILEGCQLNSYYDSAGILTIGYGHTSAAGHPQVIDGMHITQANARAILRNDLQQYEAAVCAAVLVPLNVTQFAALVIFCYNIGVVNFARSSLVKKLNQGLYMEVPIELMKWVRVRGALCPGLVHRRAKEITWWHKSAHASYAKHNNSTAAGTTTGSTATTASSHAMLVPEGGLAKDLAKNFGIRALAPLTGIVAALANMVAQAPVLQLVVAMALLLGSASGLYYYYKYHCVTSL